MSKKNHEQVLQLIQSAIAACGYDSAMATTKSYLASALNAAQVVGTKRNRRLTNEKNNKIAKTKKDEWWDMIRKNAAANAEYNLESQEEE